MPFSRAKVLLWIHCVSALGLISVPLSTAAASNHTESAPPKAAEAIPWPQIGAKAGADYQGDGLMVTPTESGARLRCVFQRLEAEATTEGLWLTSTVTNAASDRFRLLAMHIARTANSGMRRQSAAPTTLSQSISLPRIGSVTMGGQTVRFTRPGLVEEYTVSMDGVRQDFVIAERPAGDGELQLLLNVTGARVEATAYGAQLMLEQTGRKIAYSRLYVTDASGRELPARIEVTSGILPDVEGGHPAARTLREDFPSTPARANAESAGLEAPALRQSEMPAATAPCLAVVVNDADAVYPVRIDPTFSDANWISMGGLPGPNGDVFAATMDNAGNLYIGGNFTVVGEGLANRIAKWDGTNWSALGPGIGGGAVNAIAVSQANDVYVGGSLMSTSLMGTNTTSNIFKWDGTNWSLLGSGLNSFVLALATSGTDLYAGGDFTTAGGKPANRIAKWDGTNWSALDLGMYGQVYALAVSGGDLYAGGNFTSAGTNSTYRIAKWNGTNWSALGSGIGWVDSTVFAVTASGNEVYAGGDFGQAGGIPAVSIAKWNGTNWSALGAGLGYRVRALAMMSGELYAAGRFTTSGGTPVSRIARWNGSTWTGVSSGMNDEVRALAAHGGNLFAAGFFTTAGDKAAEAVARWDGNDWASLGSGMNGPIVALATSGNDLYAAGGFTTARNGPANRVAKWNETNWMALGSGMNGGVSALAVSGSELYAGGNFTQAGGIAATNMAKWNGSIWTALGSGMNGGVNALAVSGSNIYAGGWFTTAGGIDANYIAKWDGSSWSALGSGMAGYYIEALALSGNDLYAAGYFTNAGGSEANYIAKWNGSSWMALGSGMNGGVNALAVSGSNVYAGGWFTTAGGIDANYIAKWDGSSWWALGSGMAGTTPYVNALAVSGHELYAGGNFKSSGGNSAMFIAKWNGSTWSRLGSGMNSSVQALAVSHGDLYAGGWFTTAGGKACASIARAILNEGSVLSLQPGVPGPNANMLTFAGLPTNSYPVQFATNLTTSPWFTFATNTANANGRGTVLDPAATNDQRFYRVIVP